MKNVIAVFLLLAVSAMGTDLSDTWTGSFRAEGGDHDTPQMFLLKQDGSKLSIHIRNTGDRADRERTNRWRPLEV